MDDQANRKTGPESISSPSFGPNYNAPESFDTLDDTLGNIAEILGETHDVRGGALARKKTKAAAKRRSTRKSIAQIRAELLKNLPSQKVMKKQVEREIKKEIKVLQKRAMRMVRSPGSINPFELTNLVRKMRNLRQVLSSLLKTSFENLKTLWLRFVHGIM